MAKKKQTPKQTRNRRFRAGWCVRCKKNLYQSRDVADQKIHEMKRSFSEDPDDLARLNAYRCPRGRKWHIGHSRHRQDGFTNPTAVTTKGQERSK